MRLGRVSSRIFHQTTSFTPDAQVIERINTGIKDPRKTKRGAVPKVTLYELSTSQAQQIGYHWAAGGELSSFDHSRSNLGRAAFHLVTTDLRPRAAGYGVSGALKTSDSPQHLDVVSVGEARPGPFLVKLIQKDIIRIKPIVSRRFTATDRPYMYRISRIPSRDFPYYQLRIGFRALHAVPGEFVQKPTPCRIGVEDEVIDAHIIERHRLIRYTYGHSVTWSS
ncbi:hypothetical protein ANO14919_089900 [Xylariales sp. No.14919]|nr:hypothetical protein ANO14919_089900 [Xylariales sp. No.14919]